MRAVLALLFVTSACATAHENVKTPVFSPSEVLANTKELDGKEILVRGWFGGCKPNDDRICGLYSSRHNAMGPRPLEWPLPIAVDDVSSSLNVREVVVSGRYVVTCRNSAITICLDNNGYFKVLKIEDH